MELDFSLIKRAGVSQREFSQLAGVSRVTTNLWVAGKMKPHRLQADKIAAVMRALEAAVTHEELPLPGAIPVARRIPTIQRILQQRGAPL